MNPGSRNGQVSVCLIIGAAAIIFEALALGAGAEGKQGEAASKATVGAYYFDGWAGRNRHSGDPQEPWATNAPTHLTRRMIEEFPEREPIWGWRDDSLPVTRAVWRFPARRDPLDGTSTRRKPPPSALC